jgi:EAL domain-containing protein (putative c-di-GMP-specific phosphodiesterase class I)
MKEAEDSIDAVHTLAALGVRLSIDDFGTGYSSLAYLKRFSAQVLKIDKSFVDGLGADPQDTAIVGATIALADALGMETVAEGVEEADQLVHLERLGCDRAQGYLFSRPLGVAEMTTLLARLPRPAAVTARA